MSFNKDSGKQNCTKMLKFSFADVRTNFRSVSFVRKSAVCRVIGVRTSSFDIVEQSDTFHNEGTYYKKLYSYDRMILPL